MDLLKILIQSSEKAANIARLLRECGIFQKLVDLKSSDEANPRFQEDFKTLADVLIQEMVKYDVGLQFPHLKERIHGEETNHFYSSQLDKMFTVEIKETQQQTATLLTELLNYDRETAELLATEVHKSVIIDSINTKVPCEEFSMDLDKLSIWIDPIDGTNEYVKGGNDEKVGQFYQKGLKCVTVLIGVYDESGEPVMGVINQPFFDKLYDKGFQCNWGVTCQTENGIIKSFSSVEKDDFQKTFKICVGESEDPNVVRLLQNAGFRTMISRGAGYKLLAVILGLMDAYVLSKSTSYFWDTCAPQAILRSLGGNIVTIKGLKENKQETIKYHHVCDKTKCNEHGIIAYRDENVLKKLMESIDWSSL